MLKPREALGPAVKFSASLIVASSQMRVPSSATPSTVQRLGRVGGGGGGGGGGSACQTATSADCAGEWNQQT